MISIFLKLLALLAAAMLLVPLSAGARLSHLVIDQRIPLKQMGGPDGKMPYEQINGHMEGLLDPSDAHNTIITDLNLAPVDPRGSVVYSANFTIVKPVDMSRSTGVLYDMIPNRGHGEAVRPDPWGHVHVMVGWQGDIRPQKGLYTAQVPPAHNRDGSAITGPILARFLDMRDRALTLPIVPNIDANTLGAQPVSLDTTQARLFYQEREGGPQIDVPSSDWAFADCVGSAFPGRPDAGKLSLKGGFSASRAYSLVYTGKDPLVLGIGLAVTRDLVSFLRYEKAGDDGSPNPLAGQIKWAITTGTSQSGNYIRTFLFLGFNADEHGRIVFDGANPNIAARIVPINIRFGIPGGMADLYQLGSDGVVWWSPYEDTARGLKRASLLDRCIASGTCPKIIETFGSSEIWNLHMSPDLVGTDAKADLPLPSNVRRYYFPGVTHGGAPESAAHGFTTRPVYDKNIACVLPENPNESRPLLRAAIADLIAWVRDGTEPPPSAYPTLAHGDLVPPQAATMGFPVLPGGVVPDGKINPFFQQDVGGAFDYADLSGVPAFMPPRCVGEIPSLVPKVDADGNETAGVPSPLLRVPLGTYTGWNAHATGFRKGEYAVFLGGFIPFAKTKAERLANHDPRPSLEERYGSHDAYVSRVRSVVEEMVAGRRLLRGDATKIIDAAEASDVLR